MTPLPDPGQPGQVLTESVTAHNFLALPLPGTEKMNYIQLQQGPVRLKLIIQRNFPRRFTVNNMM